MKVIKPEQVALKKRRILEAAMDILQEEGISKLSIRAIAKRIDQTPGIIYHYYQDKDAILAAIVQTGYQEIIATLQKAQSMDGDAEQRLRHTLTSYIDLMIDRSELFQLLIHSDHADIAAQINLLEEGIRWKRNSMAMLCKGIELGVQEGCFSCNHIELRAQCIWCSIYGRIERLIQEQIENPQKERLIQEEISFVIDSLKK